MALCHLNISYICLLRVFAFTKVVNGFPFKFFPIDQRNGSGQTYRLKGQQVIFFRIPDPIMYLHDLSSSTLNPYTQFQEKKTTIETYAQHVPPRETFFRPRHNITHPKKRPAFTTIRLSFLLCKRSFCACKIYSALYMDGAFSFLLFKWIRKSAGLSGRFLRVFSYVCVCVECNEMCVWVFCV